uniref:Uncharacterized protein n=1 Tax=viral metagenome TaxID=1070528 RepID=A0A6C0EC05_9ZZZZ
MGFDRCTFVCKYSIYNPYTIISYLVATLVFVFIDYGESQNYIKSEKLHWSNVDSIITNISISQNIYSTKLNCENQCLISSYPNDYPFCNNLNFTIAPQTFPATIKCYADEQCCEVICKQCSEGNCECKCSFYKKNACNTVFNYNKYVYYYLMTDLHRHIKIKIDCTDDNKEECLNLQSVNSHVFIWIRDTNETSFDEPDYSAGYTFSKNAIIAGSILYFVATVIFVIVMYAIYILSLLV